MGDVFSRSYYRDSMAETMKELFNFYCEEHDATTEACQKIIDTWKRNKGDMLDERFKNISGFDKEQHHIKLSNKLFREFDANEVGCWWTYLPIDCRERVLYEGKSISDWADELDITRKYLSYARSCPASLINYHALVGIIERNKKAQAMYNAHRCDAIFTDESVIEYNKRRAFVHLMQNKLQQFIDEETVNKVNELYPDVHAHVGQKTSKMVRKWCTLIGLDKIDKDIFNFEKAYAKFADAINPLELKETVIISWNPMDYLTMSFFPNSTSCHSIDKENLHEYDSDRGEFGGCYSSGPLSYMLDGVSVVAYTINNRDNDGEDPLWNLYKVQRQMFHIDFNTGKLIVQGRLYPSDQCDADDFDEKTMKGMYGQWRAIVQSIVAQAFDIPNLWTNKKGTSACNNVIRSHGTHYRDYNYYSNCNVGRHESLGDEEIIIEVGHNPICPTCGDEHYTEAWVYCDKCRDDHYGQRQCEDCGTRVDEDEIHYVDGYGYCCNDCCTYCEYHDEYERGDLTYIDNYGDVCEYAIEDMLSDGDLYECDECGNYVHYSRSYNVESEDGMEILHFCCANCMNRFLNREGNEDYRAV